MLPVIVHNLKDIFHHHNLLIRKLKYLTKQVILAANLKFPQSFTDAKFIRSSADGFAARKCTCGINRKAF